MLVRILRRCASSPRLGQILGASNSSCLSSPPASSSRLFSLYNADASSNPKSLLTQKEYLAKLEDRMKLLPKKGFKSPEEEAAYEKAKNACKAKRENFRTYDQFVQALTAEREADYKESDILRKASTTQEIKQMRREFQPLRRNEEGHSVKWKKDARLVSPNESEYQRDMKNYKREMKDLRTRMQFDYQEHVKLENAEIIRKYDEIQAQKAERQKEKAIWKEEKQRRHQEWLEEDRKRLIDVRDAGKKIREQNEAQLETQRLYQVQQLVNEQKYWLLKDEDITEDLFEQDHGSSLTGFVVNRPARDQRRTWRHEANIKGTTFDLRPHQNLNFEQRTEEWMTDSDEDREFYENIPK